MSESVFVAIVMGSVIVPVISIIGFLIRNLLKSIEDKIDSNGLNVIELKLSLSSIKSGLLNIEKDIDRQNKQVKDLSQIVMNNAQKIVEHGHEINNLKAQGKMLVQLIESLDK